MRNVYARLGRSVAFQWALISLAGAFLGAPQAVRAQTPTKGSAGHQGTLPKSAKPATPCCPITGINTVTGVVTARVNATGKTVQFKVKSPQTLRSLKVGQTVSFGKPGSSSTTGPRTEAETLDPNSIDEGAALYINGVYMGDVVGVYGGIYGQGPMGPEGPGPNPGGPTPGCTTCRDNAFQQLLACRNNANQTYQSGSAQWVSAMQNCQQTYTNAVTQCGCGGSGSAGGSSACTSCTNRALQQLIACIKAANQQFQQHKSAAAATQLQTDLDACNTNYEKAINACPCH